MSFLHVDEASIHQVLLLVRGLIQARGVPWNCGLHEDMAAEVVVQGLASSSS